MRIGELSKRSGVSRDTIRFYERHGLLSSGESGESSNNYRSYGDDALLTLEIVKDAQAAGMSVADLSVFIGQLAAAEGDDFDGDAFLAAKIEEVEARIAASERFLETLRATRDALERAPRQE